MYPIRYGTTGGDITFTTEARGDDLTFQWQKNGTNLKSDNNYSGTGTNTLNIRQVKKSDAGCYRCLLTNEVKSEGEISEEAKLNVCECLACNSVIVLTYYNNLVY